MSEPSTLPSERDRAWVDVDLRAMVRNAHRVLASVRNVPLIPMVKADAYGLGMTPVADALLAGLPADALHAFGVATLSEGEMLRAHGWEGRIIVFSPTLASELGRAVNASLEVSVSSFADIDACAAAGSAERPIRVHTEVDSGMGRSGFPAPGDPGAWVDEVRARMTDGVGWAGCYTHFHSADEPDLTACDAQWRHFRVVRDAVREKADGVLLHACNSAAAMRRPEYALDGVRPGIFLYGGGVGAAVDPEPVAHVRARVGLVADAEPGRTVGYGATYAASREERWATVLAGYGDGVPRALWTGEGRVSVRGRNAPIVGRISMDMTVVDITDAADIGEGEVATIVGRDGPMSISLDEVATRCGTISYEILTGLTRRLPRIYHS